MARTCAHGCIRPDQQNTNDEAAIIGAGLQVNEADTGRVQETKEYRRKLKTLKNHRNCIAHIYKFLQQWYPDYCQQGGVVPARNDQGMFHHANTHELKYKGMNIMFIVKAFLADKKTKADCQMSSSFTQIQKYHDVILWGEQRKSTSVFPLPTTRRRWKTGCCHRTIPLELLDESLVEQLGRDHLIPQLLSCSHATEGMESQNHAPCESHHLWDTLRL
jgi:hypothetical protein